MTPQETSQLLVQFVAPASPWWLLVLAPAAAALGWWLYHRDLVSLPRAARLALLSLRCLLLTTLVILAFRPNLVRRVTLTYPGRILFVIDDSRSMLTRDDRMSDTDALRIARATSNTADADAPLKAAADHLADALARLREFDRYARTTERANDTFWEQAGQAQQEVDRRFARATDTAGAAKLLVQKNAPASESELNITLALLTQLRADAGLFFFGDHTPGRKAFDDFASRADAIALHLLDLQSALDRHRLATGDKELREKADAARARTRLDLAADQLACLLPTLAHMLPNQGFEAVSLSTGAHKPLEKSTLQTLTTYNDKTDLPSRLTAISEEPAEFPLSAIVLVTDGRDVTGRPLTNIESELARKQIPVFCAGAGESTEPTDLAVIDIVAPPLAIAGRPITVTAIIKASLPRPAHTQIELSCDGKSVSTTAVDLMPSQRIAVPITFMPDRIGFFRFALKIATPEGVAEVFPTENNTGEFVLNVRKEPLRVLLLDWTPRWETRIALSTLQRMPGVELNAIIGTTQKEQTLTRGVERGAWPDNVASLDLYDLVILGELPEGTLTDVEWAELKTWVDTHAGTLVFLAPRGQSGQLMMADSARALLPVVPAGPTTRPEVLHRIDQLSLTAAGRRHPLTLALADTIAPADESRLALASLRPAGQPLLMDSTTQTPLIAWQPLGKGKCLLIDSDRLWLTLNPTAHRAHQQLFVELVTWCIDGAWTQSSETATPKLAIDRRRGDTDQGTQIWGQNLPTGSIIEAVIADATIAESPALPTRSGAAMSRADFMKLPPRDITFRLKSDPRITTAPVLLTARDAELHYFARDDRWLAKLAAATGGESRPMFQMERLLQNIEPKQRVERQEHVWRLWDSPLVMSLLVLVLTVEWVWRKFVGLV